MPRVKRLLKSCWSGMLLGVSIGLGFGVFGILIELSSLEPVYGTDWRFFLTRILFPTAIGGFVGIVAGVASGIPRQVFPV